MPLEVHCDLRARRMRWHTRKSTSITDGSANILRAEHRLGPQQERIGRARIRYSTGWAAAALCRWGGTFADPNPYFLGTAGEQTSADVARARASYACARPPSIIPTWRALPRCLPDKSAGHRHGRCLIGYGGMCRKLPNAQPGFPVSCLANVGRAGI